jgi:surface antigen
MAERISFRRRRIGRAGLAAMTLCGLGMLAAAAFSPVYADPPAWTPASGRAAKGGGASPEGTGQQLAYRLPPGLQDGRCRPEMFDSSAAGGLVSAAAGGFTAARFASGHGKSRLAATAIGALIGAVVGHRIDGGIARAEEICFSESFEHLPDHETVAWMDPALGAHYSVSLTKTMRAVDGRYCREYTARATLNGQAAGTYGTACRQADGRWELIN